MKRALLCLMILLSCLFRAGAQKPRVQDFAAATDSLSRAFVQRSGVYTTVRLDKVLIRGHKLDFYFSQELSDFPWRKADVPWFEKLMKELYTPLMGTYKFGEIYAKRQSLDALPMPELTSDGKPAQTSLKADDPGRKTPPLLQREQHFPKGLENRHIALWQSHGRYYEVKTGRWEWQRACNHRTCEDLFTQSFVIPFLIPMLENAGAVVLTPRERDIQPYEVVCDNDPSFIAPREGLLRRKGSYREIGSWTAAGPGFADISETYTDYETPFGAGTARKAEATPHRRRSTAVWTAPIPQKGEYAVYVTYPSFPESSSEARYTVKHLGGETRLKVNQKMGGGTWIYLGTFQFEDEGSVELSSESPAGTVVSADAVRFGGGMGKVVRNGSTSGLPAYVEGALYQMQWNGVDMQLFDDWDNDYTKDFAGRGKWVQELSGGSRVNPAAKGRGIPFDLSLAFHTDAGITPNDSIVGTLAIYTLMCDNSDKLPDGSSRMHGRLLCDQVQSQIVNDLRAGFEPQWSRRQTWDRSYSESRTTGVPGMLLELLSHQNFADMRYGLDPAFRFCASRAVYKGILKYLSARYGCRYVVQPLPVNSFKASLDGDNAILSWAATPDSLESTASPDWYLVQTRIGDGAFDKGVRCNSTTIRLPLEKGKLHSYRIVACNEGGMSFPSEILSVGIPEQSRGKVLVVNDFTRVSAPAWFDSPGYAGFLDQLDGGVPWGKDILFAGSVNQFDRSAIWTDDDNPGFGGCYDSEAGKRIAGNSFDFVSKHAGALLGMGFSVASSSALAFDGALDGAFALDLVCGKQVRTRMGSGRMADRYGIFTPELMKAIRSFTDAGGSVLISGAYIGTDAWDRIYPVERAPESVRRFIKEVLGYSWVTNFGDNSGKLLPAEGSPVPLQGATYQRELSESIYRVENPDGIQPAGSKSSVILRYSGNRIPAAVVYEGKGYRTAAFGFPLETSPECASILEAVMGYFGK